MLELSGLTTVNQTGHMEMHLRHAILKSWLDYTNDHYSQQYHGYSSVVRFPLPRQDTDEEYEWVMKMNGVRYPPKVRKNERMHGGKNGMKEELKKQTSQEPTPQSNQGWV
jgi:hypothetical protein